GPRAAPGFPGGLRARGGWGRIGAPHSVVAATVLEVVVTQVLVAAEEDVLRHVGRVAAGGRLAAQRLGQAPDVVRAGAAAHTQIAVAAIERRPSGLAQRVRAA